MSEVEVRAILRLIHRACKSTCTGPGRNNCLGFAIAGELKRIHEQHDVPWPCDFPEDGNGFRRYIWDRIRKEPDRWATLAISGHVGGLVVGTCRVQGPVKNTPWATSQTIHGWKNTNTKEIFLRSGTTATVCMNTV